MHPRHSTPLQQLAPAWQWPAASAAAAYARPSWAPGAPATSRATLPPPERSGSPVSAGHADDTGDVDDPDAWDLGLAAWVAHRAAPLEASSSAPGGPAALLRRSWSDAAAAPPASGAPGRLLATFSAGVTRSGWLWKRFGHGHRTQWRRLWVFLSEDRLCFSEASASQSGGGGGGGSGGGGGGGAEQGGATQGSTLASLLAKEEGCQYIALDRISLRPLPHRRKRRGPSEPSAPDAGVAIIDKRVLTGRPLGSAACTVFSITAGAHTSYLAADSARDAEAWVSAIRAAWRHCYAHTARRTTGAGSPLALEATQRLAAENAALRDSVRDLSGRLTASDGAHWRMWLEEKGRREALQAHLEALAEYEVAVTTGGAKGAGTDARVWVELRGGVCVGEDGGGYAAGGEVRLLDADSRVAPFQRGATDAFVICCRDVGRPGEVRVWHDNTGRHPDWWLLEVRVRKRGQEEWRTFPCARWLSAAMDDGRICRVLRPAEEQCAVRYRAVVVTSDVRGAGTDARVWLQLHGTGGDGAAHALAPGARGFERGSTLEVTLEEEGDLGELAAVTVTLKEEEEEGEAACDAASWRLDHVEVARAEGGAPYVFEACCWFGRQLGGGVMERRLPASRSPAPRVWYELHLATCDERGAGTDADVSVCLEGTAGDSGRLLLASRPDHFGRGQRNSFRLRLLDLGELLRLRVGIQGGDQAAAWKLDMVEVVHEASGAVTYFDCGRWLGAAVGEGVCEVELQATSEDPRTTRAEYKVTFHTSDIKGAGATSRVWFQLHGAVAAGASSSIPQEATATPSVLTRASAHSIRRRLPSVGLPSRLSVWVEAGGDGKGNALEEFKGWHLAKVDVVCGQEAVTFPCHRWLGWDGTAHAPSRVDLVPGPSEGLHRYRIALRTGGTRGAGTDARVCVELVAAAGEGRAGPFALDRPDAFERGQEDVFEVEAAPLPGPLTHLRVGITPGAGAGGRHSWLLRSAAVTTLAPVAAGGGGAAVDGAPAGWEPSGAVAYFWADRWLSQEAGLVAELDALEHLPSSCEEVPATLQVFTSNLRGAATDANVEVQLLGEGGETPWTQLVSNARPFRRGQVDTFHLSLPDVGPPTHLRVRIDGTGAAPSWHLDHALLTWRRSSGASSPTDRFRGGGSADGGRGGSFWFSARRWLGGEHPREVQLPGSCSDPGLDCVDYRVTLYTSDVRGAGSEDASVEVEAVGRLGSSGWVALEAKEAGGGFRRGGVDAYHLRLPPLGALSSLLVSVDPQAAAWHLHFAEVACPVSGEAWYFVHDSWLGGGQGAPSTVELRASDSDPRHSLRTYQVVTHTSDCRGAGTDATVSVELRGSGSGSGAAAATSGRRALAPAGPECFARGRRDTFALTCHPLGRLRELWIGHDGHGPGSGWHLSQVEATDTVTGEVTYFGCDAWLCQGQGDGRTERLLTASATDPRAERMAYHVAVHTSDLPGASTNGPVRLALHGSQGAHAPATLDARAASEAAGRLATLAAAAAAAGGAAAPVAAAGAGAGASASKGPVGLYVFGRGCAAEFVVEGRDLADLDVLAVDLRGRPSSSWHLSHVEVSHLRSGRRWSFPCHRWLGGGAGGGVTSLELRREGTPGALVPEQEFRVAVVTSDCEGAGATARVSLQLYGEGEAEGGPYPLEDPPGSGSSSTTTFPAGSTRTFRLAAPVTLGELRRLRVTAASPSPPPWRLECIGLTPLPRGRTVWFWAGAWLGGRQGCELVLDASAEGTDPREGREAYRVTAHTGVTRGAVAAQARVFVDIAGDLGFSGPVELASPGQTFEPGSVDSFDLALPPLGELQQLEVWLEGEPEVGWQPKWLEVLHRTSGKVWFFPCQQWLDPCCSDGATRRRLAAACAPPHDKAPAAAVAQPPPPSPPPPPPPAPLSASYQLEVCTSDLPGAGTDARVFIQLLGERGEGPSSALTTPLAGGEGGEGGAAAALRGQREPFSAGALDVFLLEDHPDVGALVGIRVGHDGVGMHSAWHVAWVRVTAVATHEATLFPCHRWLDAALADGATWAQLSAAPQESRLAAAWAQPRTLPPPPPPPPPPPSPPPFPSPERRAVRPSLGRGSPELLAGYRVTFNTSNVLGAGTDACVSFELFGDTGSSGIVHTLRRPSHFQRGCRDAFLYPRLPCLGALAMMRVGTDGSGLFAAWHLRTVEVVHVASGERWLFLAHAWIDHKCHWQRLLAPAPVALSPPATA